MVREGDLLVSDIRIGDVVRRIKPCSCSKTASHQIGWEGRVIAVDDRGAHLESGDLVSPGNYELVRRAQPDGPVEDTEMAADKEKDARRLGIHIFEYTSYQEAQRLADWVEERLADTAVTWSPDIRDEIVSTFTEGDLIIVREDSGHFERYRQVGAHETETHKATAEPKESAPTLPDDQLRLMVFQSMPGASIDDLQKNLDWVRDGKV